MKYDPLTHIISGVIVNRTCNPTGYAYQMRVSPWLNTTTSGQLMDEDLYIYDLESREQVVRYRHR